MVQEIGLVLVSEKRIRELEMLLALYYSAIALKRRGMLSAEYTEAEWEEDLDTLQAQAEELLDLDEATIAAAFEEEES